MRDVIFTQHGFVFQRKAGKISRSHGAGPADIGPLRQLLHILKPVIMHA